MYCWIEASINKLGKGTFPRKERIDCRVKINEFLWSYNSLRENMAASTQKEPPIYEQRFLERDRDIHSVDWLQRIMFYNLFVAMLPQMLGHGQLLVKPSTVLDPPLYSNQHQHQTGKILCDGCLQRLETALNPSNTSTS